MIVKSLEPVIDEGVRCLVLGAAPDETSARMRQYYADRYNIFWDVIAMASRFEMPLGYCDRLEYLKARGLALWYVIEECEREGDIDSSIRNERPNDFEWLLGALPGIKTVVFNGAKAERLYRRHFGLPSAPGTVDRHRLPFHFAWVTIPSTSATPVKPMRYVKPCAERLGLGMRCVQSLVFREMATCR
ncbi:MAG: DNA-deoxyinosine glycosylase [Chloroflexia bacterium]